MAIQDFTKVNTHSLDSMRYLQEMVEKMQEDIIKASSLSMKPFMLLNKHTPEEYKRTFTIDLGGINTAGVKGSIAGKNLRRVIDELKFKKEDKVEALKGHRNWEFEVPHEKLICVDEVDKYVTRDNPLIFVQYDNVITFLVHNSIVNKASILKKSPKFFDELLQVEGKELCFGISTPDKIKKITEKVRGIKKAAWGKKVDRKNVRVIVPKI